jgi:glycosyltransferase involved in cell wall biosynthesis
MDDFKEMRSDSLKHQISLSDSRSPKVSVLLLTYNHERFIGDAIEGFLIQKTNFPCELVIADDCSTDGTREVIRRYWEKHPDRIRLLLNRHNLHGGHTMTRAYQACRGQYVAYVEGDDYWTAPDKLQRQADLLDRHPDYAICFHSVMMIWDDGSRAPMLYRPARIRDRYTLRDLVEKNFIASCSVMYRRAVLDRWPAWFYSMPVGDWSQHVLHAQHGDIGYLDEPMGVYRQHRGGVYSMKPATYRLRIPITVLQRFRCILGREFHSVIDRALCRSYYALIHQYCDEGRVTEARQCLVECLRQVRPGLHIPVRGLLRAAVRASTPRFYGLGQQAFHRLRQIEA